VARKERVRLSGAFRGSRAKTSLDKIRKKTTRWSTAPKNSISLEDFAPDTESAHRVTQRETRRVGGRFAKSGRETDPLPEFDFDEQRRDFEDPNDEIRLGSPIDQTFESDSVLGHGAFSDSPLFSALDPPVHPDDDEHELLGGSDQFLSQAQQLLDAAALQNQSISPFGTPGPFFGNQGGPGRSLPDTPQSVRPTTPPSSVGGSPLFSALDPPVPPEEDLGALSDIAESFYSDSDYEY
jgi:hypothetical protein